MKAKYDAVFVLDLRQRIDTGSGFPHRFAARAEFADAVAGAIDRLTGYWFNVPTSQVRVPDGNGYFEFRLAATVVSCA